MALILKSILGCIPDQVMALILKSILGCIPGQVLALISRVEIVRPINIGSSIRC